MKHIYVVILFAYTRVKVMW